MHKLLGQLTVHRWAALALIASLVVAQIYQRALVHIDYAAFHVPYYLILAASLASMLFSLKNAAAGGYHKNPLKSEWFSGLCIYFLFLGFIVRG